MLNSREAYLLNDFKSDQVFHYRCDETTGLIIKDYSPGVKLNAIAESMSLGTGRSPEGAPRAEFDGAFSNLSYPADVGQLDAKWSNKSEFTAYAVCEFEDMGVWTDLLQHNIFELWGGQDNNVSITKRADGDVRCDVEIGAQIYRVEQAVTPTKRFTVGFNIWESGGGNKSLDMYFNGEYVSSDTEVSQVWTGVGLRLRAMTSRNATGSFTPGILSELIMWNGQAGGDEGMKQRMRF